MSMLVGNRRELLTSKLVYQMPCGRSWRIAGSKNANVDHLPRIYWICLMLAEREEFELKSEPMPRILGFQFQGEEERKNRLRHFVVVHHVPDPKTSL